MPFEKGHKKATGRPKGKANKVSMTVKEIYADILSKEQKHWPAILEKLRNENPYQYMMVMDKISNKVVANKKDITSDGEQIGKSITIIEDRSQRKAD